MPDGWSQAVSCRDAAGRKRDVKVFLIEMDIVVVSPPGELVRLSADESMLLRSALADAEEAQQKRRRT